MQKEKQDGRIPCLLLLDVGIRKLPSHHLRIVSSVPQHRKRIKRFYTVNNEQREKLGVCVPSENGFQLDTKIPIKRLPKGDLSFYIEPKETDRKDTIVPLAPNEPFGYLAELRNASFIMEDDQPALSIKSCHRSEEGFECP